MDDVSMLIGKKPLDVVGFLQLNVHGHQNQVYFRPVYHFFMLATYAFFGNCPIGYNVFNIVLFYFACFSIYHLINALFKNFTLAFLTSILFCVHPINGVLVNQKICAGYSMLIITAALSLMKFMQAFEEVNNLPDFIASMRQAGRLNDLFLGGIYFGLALMCHEVAIMVPFLLICIFFILKNDNFLTALKKSSPALLLLYFYLIFRFHYFSLKHSVLDNISFFKMSFFQYFASYAKLVFWYISKLFVPDGIVLAWETYVLPQHALMWIMSFLLMIAVLLFLVVRYWKRNIVTFSLVWLFIGFGIVLLACLSRPALGFVIQPHWLSLSSIGFFLMSAAFLVTLSKYVNGQIWILIFILIVALYGGISRKYNDLWSSQKGYCRYWLTVSPSSFWPNFWLGHSYMVEGEYIKAKIHFNRNLTRGIHEEKIYGNLGIVEYELKNYDNSISYLKKAQVMSPNAAETYYYLGLNYVKKNQFEKAENYYLQAIKLDPYLLSSREELARLYESQERDREAHTVRQSIRAISMMKL